jgi:hypothetical protein
LKVGLGAVELLSEPELALHLYVRAAGAASLSCAVPLSEIVPPTSTSLGEAPMPSSTGHMLMLPLISTLPARDASWHVMGIVSVVVCPAVTEVWPDPLQVTVLSVDVPLSEME